MSVDMALEVVTLPVSDIDRAKAFYESLGWRTDADIVAGDAFRVVQVTPPHSACSISFGKGLTTAEPGSAQRLLLVVSDIEAARAAGIASGAVHWGFAAPEALRALGPDLMFERIEDIARELGAAEPQGNGPRTRSR